jgi:hypothetical protein
MARSRPKRTSAGVKARRRFLIREGASATEIINDIGEADRESALKAISEVLRCDPDPELDDWLGQVVVGYLLGKEERQNLRKHRPAELVWLNNLERAAGRLVRVMKAKPRHMDWWPLADPTVMAQITELGDRAWSQRRDRIQHRARINGPRITPAQRHCARNYLLRLLIFKLALKYESQTERRPGRNSEPTGPFFRLVKIVLNVCREHMNDTALAKEVKRALEEHLRWKPQPKERDVIRF